MQIIKKDDIYLLGWYYTGDVGYFDEDGDIFVVDKARDIIKYNGFNISPRKIEEVLLHHPDVREVVVVGEEIEVFEKNENVEILVKRQVAKAFVVKNEGAKV